MKKVLLKRFTKVPPKYNQGTFGVLTTDGFECVTVEQDWEDNKSFVSCIPTGTYICKVINSPRFGRVYEVHGVIDRTHVLIHPANYAYELQGCIALGKRLGGNGGYWMVTDSANTVREFMNHMNDEDFELTIED